MTVLHNPLAVAAIIAMVSAQIMKFLIILITERRWAPKRMTETGGMPSSHTSTVAAVTTSAGLTYGVESAAFAIALVFGIIVIYDATGIRRAAGRHAEILNDLMEELSHLFDEKDHPKALKTLLGHTYPQVFVGALLGVGTAFVINYYFQLKGIL